MFYFKWFSLLFLGLFLISCDKNNDGQERPPTLSTALVDFNKVTHVILFGEDLTATQKNPAFEYIVDNANEEVISCSNGFVEKIIRNTAFSDYEIHIRPSSRSEWIIIYDHVKDINLSEGDNVEPGTLLGIIGEGNRVELQVNQNNMAHCPLNFGTTAFVQEHLHFTEDWCLEDTVIP